MLMAYFDAFARDYRYYKGGAWCYEDGCIYRGLALLDTADPGGPWFAHLKRLVDGQIDEDGHLAGYRPEDFNLDNVQAGRTLLFLHRRLGDARYRIGAKALAAQLPLQPRTPGGNYWHKLVYPQQVWLDGLYMALPFQLDYALLVGDRQLYRDAIAQMESAITLLRDAGTRLYRHGYDAGRVQDWADPVTGLSRAYWSRAMGWLAMALVDVAELAGPDTGAITAACTDLADILTQHQQPDGRWLQVTDLPDLEGNYPESSATAMFAYFYIAGTRLGLPGLAAEPGLRALAGLERHALAPSPSGRAALQQICYMAGLGGFSGRNRDGSVGYYLSEPIVADDSKGVGPLMMAAAERLLRQRQPLATAV
ncbi:MAG: glycoside hydrolase family 88/105 protein [Devosia sp.]